MSNQYLGEIRLFAGNFAPKGWATCDGQLMSIQQNAALFAILGTFYGGNGIQTFALPDLRGRVPVHQGQGPGLSSYVIGEMTGKQNATLLSSNLPVHTHIVNANSGASPLSTPDNALPAPLTDSQGNPYNQYTKTAANAQASPNFLKPAGGNQPFSLVQPVTCLTFIIALTGIFPTRN